MVSLHDVHAGSWRAYRSFLDDLAGLGVGRTTLLVVPCWKGVSPVEPSSGLAAWLRSAGASGHEICLHGLTHHAERLRGGPVARAVGRWYTDREGEFQRLGYEEAYERLREGRTILARAGLDSAGFTPPAWLASRETLRALADLGFAYSTSFGSVVSPGTGARLPAPVLTFSTRSRWRRDVSRRYVPALARLVERSPVLRVAVHPGDLLHPEIRRTLDAVLRRVVPGRRAVTYQELAAAFPGVRPAVTGSSRGSRAPRAPAA